MKISQIIGIAIFLVIGVAALFFVNNEKKKVIPALNDSTGKMETYDPETWNKNSSVTTMSEESMDVRKSKERNKILTISGGILVVIIIAFVIIKSNEDKIDPAKNLAKLKEKNIISQSEYEDKIEHSKIVENQKKLLKTRQKECKKLIAELDNLKEKGILTEEEYKQKLIKIKEKTA